MGPAPTQPLVLDAGALIAIERGRRPVLALLAVAAEADLGVIVPAGVIAQVWRGGPRQARIARVIHAADTTVEPLDLLEAEAAGALCGATGTADAIDASVVITARRHRALVLTSDPRDIRQLDPDIDLEVV